MLAVKVWPKSFFCYSPCSHLLEFLAKPSAHSIVASEDSAADVAQLLMQAIWIQRCAASLVVEVRLKCTGGLGRCWGRGYCWTGEEQTPSEGRTPIRVAQTQSALGWGWEPFAGLRCAIRDKFCTLKRPESGTQLGKALGLAGADKLGCTAGPAEGRWLEGEGGVVDPSRPELVFGKVEVCSEGRPNVKQLGVASHTHLLDCRWNKPRLCSDKQSRGVEDILGQVNSFGHACKLHRAGIKGSSCEPLEVMFLKALKLFEGLVSEDRGAEEVGGDTSGTMHPDVMGRLAR